MISHHTLISLLLYPSLSLLTPLLSSCAQVTRRVNLKGVFQAAYTAGVVLPKPVAACRYHHRSITPKKLIEVR